MDNTFLVEQLGAHVRPSVQTAYRAAQDAREDARSGADRAVNLARGHTERSAHARAALDALEVFRPAAFDKRDPIGLGAVVEVEDEQGGRTLFVAPVWGGIEVTGPGGDGSFK